MSLLLHGSLSVNGFLHSDLGLPESVSKQEVEAAPSSSLEVGNWIITVLLKESESLPESREGDKMPPSMGRGSRNVWLSLICHTITLRKTFTFLANQQGSHDPALDPLIPLSFSHTLDSSLFQKHSKFLLLTSETSHMLSPLSETHFHEPFPCWLLFIIQISAHVSSLHLLPSPSISSH